MADFAQALDAANAAAGRPDPDRGQPTPVATA